MADDTFRALVLEQRDEQVTSAIRDVRREELPEGDTLVRVAYSALNYKDGLALTGKNKVVRSYPMVPGVDFSGTVEETSSSEFAPGDRVVLTGWGVGERHWGGYAQFARAKSEWLVRLPESIDLKHAMGLGTAGVTAMLCILALEEHGLTPEKGDVLVTGASGGVGGMAVALLAALGYNVTASTGRAAAHEYLQSLGANTIIDRSELTAPGGPLAAGFLAGRGGQLQRAHESDLCRGSIWRTKGYRRCRSGFSRCKQCGEGRALFVLAPDQHHNPDHQQQALDGNLTKHRRRPFSYTDGIRRHTPPTQLLHCTQIKKARLLGP
jgi:hypothetical protein